MARARRSALSSSPGPRSSPGCALEAFVRYFMGKKRFMNELHEAFEKDPALRSASCERIEGALGVVLTGPEDAGVVRTDVDARPLPT